MVLSILVMLVFLNLGAYLMVKSNGVVAGSGANYWLYRFGYFLCFVIFEKFAERLLFAADPANESRTTGIMLGSIFFFLIYALVVKAVYTRWTKPNTPD